MNTKLTLSSSPVEETNVPSDDAIRQALLRMGSGSRPQQKSNPNQHQNQKHQHQQHSSRSTSTNNSHAGDTRRRRFNENERVPVEYVGRERNASRSEALEAVVFGTPAPELEKLQRSLDLERKAREAAEHQVAELKTQLGAARTRLAHIEIELDEMRATRAAEAAATAVAISNATATAAAAAAADKPAARTRARVRTPEFADDQEPVTWWIRD